VLLRIRKTTIYYLLEKNTATSSKFQGRTRVECSMSRRNIV